MMTGRYRSLFGMQRPSEQRSSMKARSAAFSRSEVKSKAVPSPSTESRQVFPPQPSILKSSKENAVKHSRTKVNLVVDDEKRDENIKNEEEDVEEDDDNYEGEDEEEEEMASDEDEVSFPSTLSLSDVKNVPRLKIRSRKIRRFLFVWHILMLTMSMTLVVIAAYLSNGSRTIVQKSIETFPNNSVLRQFVRINVPLPPLQYFRVLFDEYSFAMHHYGWTFLLSTILYVSFFFHKFPFTWPLLCVFTLVSVILQTSNVLIRLGRDNEFIFNLQKKLRSHIKNYTVNSAEGFSLEYDYVSVWGRCCGISSKFDFNDNNLKLYRIRRGVYQLTTLRIPPTCCKQQVFYQGSNDVIKCATFLQNASDVTCLDVFYDELQKYGPQYVAVLLLMVFDIFIHAFFYLRMVKIQRPHYRYDALAELEKRRHERYDSANSTTIKLHATTSSILATH